MRIVVSGYDHFKLPSRVNVLAVNELSTPLRTVLETSTLYDFARTQPDVVTFHGRGPVYVFPFGPNATRVAVRHAWRGGWLAPLLKDRFLPPTRGLRELVNTLQLRMAGIPAPEVLALAIYPAGGPFRRADVMTRFIDGGADLAAVLGDARNDAQRRPLLDAVASLLGKLARAGAQHADLNLKNVLITAEEQGYVAHVLDVDRVHFHVANDPMVIRANLDRLIRSLRKWRERPSTRTNALPDDDLHYLTLAASAATP